MTDRKSLWNEAGKAGLLLGGVSTAYLLLTALLGKVPSHKVLLGILNFLLWAAKFAGCILLMRALMQRFVRLNPEADNSDSFRFGVVAALLSALFYAACNLAYVTFLAPDLYSAALDGVMQNPMMDANSRDALLKLEPQLPKIGFFVNLAYCFLFGTILSAILSRSIPSHDPFAQ